MLLKSSLKASHTHTLIERGRDIKKNEQKLLAEIALLLLLLVLFNGRFLFIADAPRQ